MSSIYTFVPIYISMNLTPIIKRPWWKYHEYDFISDLIPKFERYIEPFFWWWWIFFRLQPNKSIINDICPELVSLYRFIKEDNSIFRTSLLAYTECWRDIPKYIFSFGNEINFLYKHMEEYSDEVLKWIISEIVQKHSDDFHWIFDKDLIVDSVNVTNQIKKNIFSKLKRIKSLEQKKWKLPQWDLEKNIETAFRSWFYMHFRDLLNSPSRFNINKEKQIANYYFIREFCYAGMFRYNRNGDFNIPYWWIAYNNKNFLKKVEYLLSRYIVNLFSNAEIYSTDFSEIISNKLLSKNDFIFLDPPYDTEFDNYHWDVFSKKDHIRLLNSLKKTNAKFLLIIKKTDFIFDLYKNISWFNIEIFDKKYLVNIKGRNKKNVEHLVIYNYQWSQNQIWLSLRWKSLNLTKEVWLQVS